MGVRNVVRNEGEREAEVKAKGRGKREEKGSDGFDKFVLGWVIYLDRIMNEQNKKASNYRYPWGTYSHGLSERLTD